MNKGKLMVLSGPSGVGKGTVVEKLLELEDSLVVSVSATTRDPRENEVDGVHYFYITKQEFEEKLKNNELLEYNVYNGNYYGTLKSYVDNLLSQGKNVMLEIDVNGKRQVKEKCPDALTVFLTAPSMSEVERRLRKRNSETDEVIKKRLEIAKSEMEHAKEYDFVVCNDELENAVKEIINILKQN